MESKITVVTPPDIYENNNLSVFFIGMSDNAQLESSIWLKENPVYPPCNFYVYQNDNNVPWLLYAKHRCSYTLIDLDIQDPIVSNMASYLIGFSDVFYMTTNKNMKELFSHISNNYVPSTKEFLERIFNDRAK